MALFLTLVIVISSLLLLLVLLTFVRKSWWTPISIQKMMKSQGIDGLPYEFPHGNTRLITSMRNQSMNRPMEMSHDILPRIQPHVHSWIKTYGLNFMNWHGSEAQLFVTDPELVKEVLTNRDGAYSKMDMVGYAKKLIGDSLIANEGQKWLKVRRVANHTFHAESLKSMVPEMSRSVETMLERWKVFKGQEIDVHKELGLVTTEVISRTAFGSSYVEGKHIFEMVARLTALTVRNMYKLRFPGISLIWKTKDEIEAGKLEKTIKKSILDIVKKRKVIMDEGVNEFESDYLGQLVKMTYDSNESKRITIEQMIDELKTIYGAGHLTTTSLLSWTVFLLAVDQEWQDKVREEVMELFGYNNPTSDGLARLKTMNMVINESLRLYPPALTVVRKTNGETKLGNLNLPSKLNIFISILALHHNSEIWGKDVHCFRPERFANGVAKATNNNAAAFLPFGMGPRTCVGLNFTTNEAKVALSMMLQRYRFTLSVNHVHYPADVFILTPKNGVLVNLHPI
ncbi:hypothetical protein QVD17_20812 [Tagetes erecta]|uniref:Cytochrome P450 n=1 Tax=Tagetes erecta TaxID=13708 RepID=A0AAD8NRB9_TARER|nr:hypothetical protein QVD17_20812 [Tagetes erecta]